MADTNRYKETSSELTKDAHISETEENDMTREDNTHGILFYEGNNTDTGSIKSSQVIAYVKHSLQFEVKAEDLRELSYLLDPGQTDVDVDLESCRKYISDWITEKSCSDSAGVASHSDAVNLTDFKNDTSFIGERKSSMNRHSLDRDEFKPLEETNLELHGQIQNLVGQNRRLNEEYSKMREQRDSAEELASSHQHTVEAYAQRMRSMQKLIDRREQTMSDNEGLKMTVSRLYDEKVKLSSQIKQSEKLNTKLQDQLLDLELKLLKTTSDMETADKQINDIQSSLYKEKHLWARTEEEKEIIESRLVEKCRHIEQLHGIMDYLKKTNRELDDQKMELEQQLGAAQMEMASIRMKAKKLHDGQESLEMYDTESASMVKKLSKGCKQSLAVELKPQLEAEKDLPSPLCEKEDIYPNVSSRGSFEDTSSENSSQTYNCLEIEDQLRNSTVHFSGDTKADREELSPLTYQPKADTPAIHDDLYLNKSLSTLTGGKIAAERRVHTKATACDTSKAKSGTIRKICYDSFIKGLDSTSKLRQKGQDITILNEKLPENPNETTLVETKRKTKHHEISTRRYLPIRRRQCDGKKHLSSLVDALTLHSHEDGDALSKRNSRNYGALMNRRSRINPPMQTNCSPNTFGQNYNSRNINSINRRYGSKILWEHIQTFVEGNQTPQKGLTNLGNERLTKQNSPILLAAIEESADEQTLAEHNVRDNKLKPTPKVENDIGLNSQFPKSYAKGTSAFSSRISNKEGAVQTGHQCPTHPNVKTPDNVQDNKKGSYYSSIRKEPDTNLDANKADHSWQIGLEHKAVQTVASSSDTIPHNDSSQTVVNTQGHHPDKSSQHISVHATYTDFMEGEIRNPSGCAHGTCASCMENDIPVRTTVKSNQYGEKGCPESQRVEAETNSESYQSTSTITLLENSSPSVKNKSKSRQKSSVKNVPKTKRKGAQRNLVKFQAELPSTKLETITENVTPNEQAKVSVLTTVEVMESWGSSGETEPRIVSAKGQRSLLSRCPKVNSENSSQEDIPYPQTSEDWHSTEVESQTSSENMEGPRKVTLTNSSTNSTYADKEDSPSMRVVFPSLPDSVLQSLGLSTKLQDSIEGLTDEEIQDKCARLSLAFKTDKLTLDKRLEIQERSRNHTEENVDMEILSLKYAVGDLTKMCDEEDTFKLIGDLQRRLQVLELTTLRMSGCSEGYGAVQQENKMSLAMEVMIQHIDNLKKGYEKKQTLLDESRKFVKDCRVYPNSDPDRGSPKEKSFRNRTSSLVRREKMKESFCVEDNQEDTRFKELPSTTEIPKAPDNCTGINSPATFTFNARTRRRSSKLIKPGHLKKLSAMMEEPSTDIVSERSSPVWMGWSNNKEVLFVTLVIGLLTILCLTFIYLKDGSLHFTLSYYNGAQV